jgi:lysophospholipase L1-like esterase
MNCHKISAKLSCLLAVVAVVTTASSPLRAEEPKLKKGERIVFLGDSITQGGVGPKGYVTVIKNSLVASNPDLGIEIIGAGISGNKVPNLQARVDKDVVAKNPTIVVIYIGINDVWHGEKDPARGTTPEKFEAGLEEVIGKCTAAGARVILCTPTVIGEKTGGDNNLDAKLDQYSDISRGVAKKLNLQLCDLRKAFVDYLAKNNPENKDSKVLTTDRVHLNEAGNKLVADTILPYLGK